jgi:hypothetical protein
LWVGFAGVKDVIEPGREREERVDVDEWWENALETRREFAGESGAGREDVSESRDARNELLREGDLGLLSGDGLTRSSVVVVVVEMGGREELVAGVVEQRGSAAGGLWGLGELELRDGVEGETDVPPVSAAPASASGGIDRLLRLASRASS